MGKSNAELIFKEKLGIDPEEIKEKREAAWEEAHKPTPKPARPAAKPAVDSVTPTPVGVAPKKETIVINQPVTKEDVDKLGKEIDQIDAAKKAADESTTNV